MGENGIMIRKESVWTITEKVNNIAGKAQEKARMVADLYLDVSFFVCGVGDVSVGFGYDGVVMHWRWNVFRIWGIWDYGGSGKCEECS